MVQLSREDLEEIGKILESEEAKKAVEKYCVFVEAPLGEIEKRLTAWKRGK